MGKVFMKIVRSIGFVLLFALLLALQFAPVLAQEQNPILNIKAVLSANGVPAGETFEIAVLVTILEPWHINSNKPLDEFTLPTELRLQTSDAFKITEIEYPSHKLKKLEFSDEDLALYDDETIIRLKGRAAAGVAGEFSVNGSVYYQGCNDAICLAPQETPFAVRVPVLDSAQAVEPANSQYFITGETTLVSAKSKSKTFDLQKSFSRRGAVLTFLLIFLGGLGLNLTPCVYPLIPITISYFGGQTEGKKNKRIIMAVLYVLGMATVNSLLGTLAALSGGLLGSVMANPIVLIVIAAILVLLSLSMFGVYEFTLPSFMMRLGGSSQSGYPGALFMGLTMGIVAAPCIGPFVIGLLTYVALVGSPLLGFSLFFTVSLGMGLPYLFLAFFSSKIGSLPKAGDWMVAMRIIMGFVLVGMAFYFLHPIIPDRVYDLVFPLYLVLTGAYLILLNKSGQSNRLFDVIKKVLAIATLIAGAWLMKPEGEAIEGIVWQPYEESQMQAALQTPMPVILDFAAEWCIPCREMEELTFTDDVVIALSKDFALFKVDLTTAPNGQILELKDRLEVRGVPTIIFLNKEGQEVDGTRIVGFEKAEGFVEKMKMALE